MFSVERIGEIALAALARRERKASLQLRPRLEYNFKRRSTLTYIYIHSALLHSSTSSLLPLRHRPLFHIVNARLYVA